MIPLSLPAPIGGRTRGFTFLVLAICLVGAAHIADRVTFWSKVWLGTETAASGDEPVFLTVGPGQFRIPPKYLAGARRQSSGTDNRFRSLRLAMIWPGLDSPGLHSGRFQPAGMSNQPGIGSTIQIELEHNPGRRSLRARMDPFYRRLARGGELAGPNGLKILNLSSHGGSGTELIVYDPSVQNGFIARCLRQSSQPDNTVCNRAVVLTSGLELRYRFARKLLPEWRQLDTAILQKIDTFRTR